jgi:uncharacterized membrane protein HdeD (DUF308 family)
MASEGLLKVGGGRSIVWAVLLIALGFLAIALPFATSLGLVVIVAWLIIISGVVQLVHAFDSRGVGSTVWKVLVALLYVLFGLYLVTHPILGIAAFTLALAILFVIEGVSDVAAWFQNRGAPGARWILVSGLVTVVVGVMVWLQWPSSSLWVIGTLVGVSMIMTGTTRLMLALAARRLKHAVSG